MPRDADDHAPVTPWPAQALWLVEQAERHGVLLFIAGSEARLDGLARAAPVFAGGRVEVLVLPPWDTLPYDRVPPSAGAVGRRVRALIALARPRTRPRLVLTCADAVLQRVRPPGAWKGAELVLAQGEALDLHAFRAALAERGYHHLSERVDEPGEAAIRGQAIDVFPAGQSRPVRLSVERADGSDGRIAALHAFDPATQRSAEELDRVVLHPAVEFPLDAEEVENAAEALAHPDPAPAEDDAAAALPAPPRLVPLFDYLPDAAVMLDDAVEERWHAFREQVEDGFAAAGKVRRTGPGGGALPRPGRLYLTPEQAWAAVAPRLLPVDAPGTPVQASRRVGALLDLARTAAERGERVAIAASEPERVAASLARRGLEIEAAPGWDALQPGKAAALALDLSSGFARPGLLVLSAAGVLRAQGPANQGIAIDEAPRVGDVVVHLDHGVTRLDRLAEVEADGQAEERIALGFADGAELLAPLGELDRIWRYGADMGAVSLDRMGGDAWRTKRAEIEAEAAGTARGLAEAAARRAARKAPVAEPRQPAFDRLARRFPFALSPDQRAAVDATLADLACERPMNRLVCGDVGFGKTEVALRAAAAAALAGRQVAIVAPTTVLARQHLDTVRRRFAGTGVRVEGLIRGTDTPAGQAVRRGLADGSVGVVVGTHGLASERVRFARLGLVVIDEEQRFGDAHKTRLSGLGGKQAVHVLAMTATPIPRTLQEALVGLRDVSVIATAPVRRQPTRTFVLPFDPVAAREALMREHRRGGQSFVVCPRIGDLAPMAARLREAAPELRVVQAHGRMKPETLDDAMAGFAEGLGDVLLATTIVEAGLDIPRANTILVTGADRFGLAELHQLRGRVGRGQRRGSAYFMTEPGRRMGAAAVQRLRAMETLSSLGAGVAIAAADLEGRGAGDLLGERQAGHVRAVGTELYQHLLARASAELRGETPPPPLPELRVGLTGRIPAGYVPEANLRLSLYRRLARMADLAELGEFEDEAADRFGPAPPGLAALLALARLRLHCARAGIARLDAGPQAAALTPRDPANAQSLADALGGQVRNGRVILDIAETRAETRVEQLIMEFSER